MSGDKWSIELDEYQRSNLLALIEACGYGHKPANFLRGLDTGDWIGEIYIMLGGFSDPPTYRPNCTPEQMASRARAFIEWEARRDQ